MLKSEPGSADTQGMSALPSFPSTPNGYDPDRVAQVAGAFRFTEYDFFRSWAMRYIAAIKDQEIDPHGDTELTDWPGLRRTVETWIQAAQA